ncbi:MAG TPA: hypothetical protein VN231_13810 [Allosphingosinicella sp.]|nr:hypothetical protein [Allosphingosinicella sp.]
MNGNQLMVLLIVAIVMIASVARAHYGASRRKGRSSARDDAETHRLREEVKSLRDRLAVIERITVERENSLERQIEQLRDR